MIIDLGTLSEHHEIEADICIIGTGPAGITIARELMETNWRVCMLECGGQEDDPDLQRFNEGEIVGERYNELVESHYRRFGGTAHKWLTKIGEEAGARFVPLDPIDFEERSWMPFSGWPFGKEHLDPYYERAHRMLDLGPYRYAGEDWTSAERPLLPLDPSRIATGVYQVSKGNRFRHQFLDEIREADHITAYLNAFVTEIVTEPTSKHIVGIELMSRAGKRFTAHAMQYVLAAGGIENPRLLLLSDRHQAGGVGNQNDLVGRFFMEHPVQFGAILKPNARSLFDRVGFYDIHDVKGTLIGGRLNITEELRRQEQLMNISIVLYPAISGINTSGVRALRKLIVGFRRRRQLPDTAQLLLKIVAGFPDILIFAFRKHVLKHRPPADGWSEMADKPKRFETCDLVMHLEQAPDPESRVMLSEDRDSLGMKKVKIGWRFDATNRAAAKRTADILAAEFEKAGIGKLTYDPANIRVSVHHHMGTTRMHRDPQYGVVDENCKVHGVDNLYIAGCSVFPTGGFVNPTLTILALAIRLADHFKQMQLPRSGELAVAQISETRLPVPLDGNLDR